MGRKIKNQASVYEAKIDSLVREITRLCVDAGIPAILSFRLDDEHTTTYLADGDQRHDPVLRDCLSRIAPDVIGAIDPKTKLQPSMN